MIKQAHNGKKLHKQTDLTQGGIAKTILRFSLPILFSYLLQTLYTVADAAICGYTLSGNEVAGVNDTNAISFLFLQFAIGCTSGMSVLVADCAGKRDDNGLRKAFAAQIVLGVALALLLTATGLLTVKPLLRLLGVTAGGNETSKEVYRAASAYITVICGGIAAQFFYNMICCVLRSIGDSFTPLLFLLCSTLLNIALDLLFILVCGWGVTGAAAATVLSQALAAIGCFIFAFARYPALRLHARDFRAISGRLCLRTLWQGV
ncbi:MAG: polysaccharide biosynthesis C-terminal domain-containing protein, partial [Clostridiales bacterium]|nr:polysaccharide biosynthesis C-terminal domain-containing protein [Clostridiales bacterium]